MRNTHQRPGLIRAIAIRGARASRNPFAFAGLALALAVGFASPNARASGALRARLDPPIEEPVGATFRATGFDPGAPRSLVLWRWDGERYLRLDETESGRDGRFDFGIHPLALTHADYGVTEAGESPDWTGFRRYERRIPSPVVIAQEGPLGVLRVLTARAEGELRISDRDGGRLLARIPLTPTPRHEQTIDLASTLPSVWPEAIAIEHVMPDGRRSTPVIWLLEDPQKTANATDR